MNVLNKRLLGVASLLSLGVIVSWWWGQERETQVVESLMQNQKEVDAYLGRFVATTMTEQGVPNHRLEADKMIVFSGTHLSQVDKPLLTLYREDATPWVIHADYGLIQSDTDTVFLNGNVRMTNQDAQGHVTEVLTDSLEVRAKTHYALTEHQVRVNHFQGYAQGQGLQAHLREGRLALLERVRSEYEAAGH